MATAQTNWPYVINLGNSIIGVSVLAMPFCFKQCGVVLGAVLLLISSFLTSTSCNLLIKGAISSRRRSYQFLAYHTFGQVGKLAVEISIIGLLLGTCVAFYVIIGDLGSNLVSKFTGLENSSSLRTCLLVVIGLFVALPLGMLRNVESLSHLSAISLAFYLVFVAEVIAASLPNLWSGMWVNTVSYWKWDGVFKCLPIFSLAFSCQTQLFVMYDALPEPSLSRMNHITKSAVMMCTTVYMLVGFFGYVAFCDEEVMGDVLMNFRPTIFTESIKMGFVLSVAVSFPLVIFPCRASLYTLCFAKDGGLHDNIGGSTYIPPFHFKCITFAVVVTTMTIGVFVPNIEFVLAVTGATMGTMICFIFPALTYLSVTPMSKSGNKGMAQVVLVMGIFTLFISSYVLLKAPEGPVDLGLEGVKLPDDELIPVAADIDKLPDNEAKDGVLMRDKLEAGELEPGGGDNPPGEADKRQEPPNPQAPPDSDEAKLQQDGVKEEPAEEAVVDVKNEREVEIGQAAQVDDAGGDGVQLGEEAKPAKPNQPSEDKDKREVPVKALAPSPSTNAPLIVDPQQPADTVPKVQDPQAHAQMKDIKETNDEAKALLAELKVQQQENLKLIEKQKEVLEQLEQHKANAHNPGESLVGVQDGVNPAAAQDGVNPAAAQDGVNPAAAQDVVNPGAVKDVVNPGAIKDVVNPGAVKDVVNAAEVGHDQPAQQVPLQQQQQVQQQQSPQQIVQQQAHQEIVQQQPHEEQPPVLQNKHPPVQQHQPPVQQDSSDKRPHIPHDKHSPIQVPNNIQPIQDQPSHDKDKPLDPKLMAQPAQIPVRKIQTNGNDRGLALPDKAGS